jgi:hypothetical protein
MIKHVIVCWRGFTFWNFVVERSTCQIWKYHMCNWGLFFYVDGQVDCCLVLLLIGLGCMVGQQSWGAINILVLDQCFRRWHMCCFIMIHKKLFHVGNHDCVNLSLDSCIPHNFWFVCMICATLFSFDNGHVVCIKLVVHENGRGCWIFWEVHSRLQSSQRKISFLWIVWCTPWSL